MNWRPPSGAFCLKAEACRLHNRDDVVPGMIGAIQTHGELLHWHPHIHVLITCGAFTPEGDFLEFPEFDMERLLVAWQDAVFELYLAEEKIEAEVVENMRSWEHSGFSVDQSVFLPAGDQAGKDQSQLTFVFRLKVRGGWMMHEFAGRRVSRTHLRNQIVINSLNETYLREGLPRLLSSVWRTLFPVSAMSAGEPRTAT
jgi:hypothetical protein